MSQTDYKKTVIVERTDLAWGGPAPEGTTIVTDQTAAAAPPPLPATPGSSASPKGTTILGFSSQRTGEGVTATPAPGPANPMTDPVAGWLVIVQGPGRGASVQVGYGWSTVGREPGNRMVLDFGDGSITGQDHARILYDPETREFGITNSRGVNPTRVNGKAIHAVVPLVAGDLVKIGSTALRFVPFCGPDFDWSTADAGETSTEKKA